MEVGCDLLVDFVDWCLQVYGFDFIVWCYDVFDCNCFEIEEVDQDGFVLFGDELIGFKYDGV